jgi:uncharacterized protein (TIGR02246 family)
VSGRDLGRDVGLALSLVAQLPARYAQAVDSNDFEALAACFTEDAVLRVEVPKAGRSRVHEGRAAILDLFRDSFAAQRVRRHVVSSVLVQSLEKERAQIRSYVTVLAIVDDEVRPSASGVYEDTAVLLEEGWRIQERRGVFDTSGVLASRFFQ